MAVDEQRAYLGFSQESKPTEKELKTVQDGVKSIFVDARVQKATTW